MLGKILEKMGVRIGLRGVVSVIIYLAFMMIVSFPWEGKNISFILLSVLEVSILKEYTHRPEPKP